MPSPWEQRKLGELCTFSKGHGYSKADIRDVGIPLILYGRLYTQYESHIEDVDTFAVEQDGSLLSKGNEVIVPASGETAEDIAIASSVRRSGIILGGDLNVITPGSELDPDYTAIGITYGETHKDLSKRAQGKSVVHVHGDDIADVEFTYPAIEEQRAISSLVLNLDSLITLHQRKHEKLVQMKKAMLDKMFPKPSEKFPEIRFKGFTDPWEQRKLGELIQLGGSGGTPSANNPDYYGGDIPFLSIADIDGRNITNTTKMLTDKGLQNSAAWIVPSGAVSLAMYASVGKVGIIRQNTATSQAFYNMVFENEALRDFVFTRLEKAEAYSEWEPYISTGTQRNLNADKVKSFSLAVPSTEEVAEISAYFYSLDSLITLHQRKLKLLKILRKQCSMKCLSRSFT